MIPYLITGGNQQERLEQTKKIVGSWKLEVGSWQNNPDLLIVEPNPSIGINQIRQIQQFLSRKPYQARLKIVVISQAEKLTLPAQQSFLKTLEEPPNHSLIILSVFIKEQLLPTIISRCLIINLHPKTKIKLTENIFTSRLVLLRQIIKARVGERLILLEPYSKNRDLASQFLEEIIIVLREVLLHTKQYPQFFSTKIQPKPTRRELTHLLQNCQHFLNLIRANVNPRLVLENLFL